MTGTELLNIIRYIVLPLICAFGLVVIVASIWYSGRHKE